MSKLFLSISLIITDAKESSLLTFPSKMEFAIIVIKFLANLQERCQCRYVIWSNPGEDGPFLRSLHKLWNSSVEVKGLMRLACSPTESFSLKWVQNSSKLICADGVVKALLSLYSSV
jgi:hypothetical protein